MIHRLVPPRSVRVLVTAIGAATAIAACAGGGGTARDTSVQQPGSNSGPQANAPNPGAGQAQPQNPPRAANPVSPGGAAPGAQAAPPQAPGNVPAASGPAGRSNVAAPAALRPGAAVAGPCSSTLPASSTQPIPMFAPSTLASVFGHACGTNPASDVGVTPTTVNLGYITFKSATRSLGPVIEDATIRLLVAEMQYINDHGGVAGRQLKMVTCDDGGDVTRARACFEKLKDQVFAFLPSGTFVTDTIHDTLDRARVPWLSWGWFTSEWNDPYMFPCHGNGLRETANMAAWMAEHVPNLHTVGILYLNDAEDINGKDAAVRILQARGIKVVTQIAQEWDSADESNHVLAMRLANPDAILAPTWPTPIVKFFHDAEQQHYAPPLGIYAKHLVADAGYGQVFGSYIKNRFYSINSWLVSGGSGNSPAEEAAPGNEFLKTITLKYTGYENNGFQLKYTLAHHLAQTAVACTMAFADIASQIGPNLTRTALIDRLESESFDSGMGQVLRWPHGNHDREPYAFHSEYLYEWVDGDSAGGFGVKRVRPDPVTPVIPS